MVRPNPVNTDYEGVSYTNIRWKSLGTHTCLLEAIKSSVDIIAHQIKEMANATKEMESKKLEAQLNLFVEQMTYETECEIRIYAWDEPTRTLIPWRQGFRDLGEPIYTLVPCWMPKSLPPKNHCMSCFAPTIFRHPTRNECMGWFAPIRIYEQGRLVAYNAHLTIIKHGEVVSALGNIR